VRRVAIVLTALIALAVPSVAQAADYFNGDGAHGAHAITASGTIDRFELYCVGSGFENRALAFSMAESIVIGHKGKFSYKGIAYEYGPERQPRGQERVTVSGTVKSKTLHAKWKIPGCGTGTVTASRDG
jgi:hypothetical protein